MKKLISVLLLCAVLLATLAGCGVGEGIKAAVANSENVSLTASAGLGDVRVMSFNLQMEMSQHPTASVAEALSLNRKQAVAAEILSYSPDLLGTQEDGKEWIQYLIGSNGNSAKDGKGQSYSGTAGLGGDYKVIAYDNDPTTGTLADRTERCAIYYKTSTMKLIGSGHAELSYTGKTGAASLSWEDIEALDGGKIIADLALTEALAKPDKYYNIPHAAVEGEEKDENGNPVILTSQHTYILTNRRMTWGVFEDASGNQFIYVNTHLTHRSQTSNVAKNNPSYLKLREYARLAEWDILQEKINDVKTEYGDLPVFITGDMNEVLGSKTYNYILDTGYENSSKEAVIRRGQDSTYNNAFSKETAGTEVLLSQKDKVSTTTLDYCFISEGDFTVDQYQVGNGRVELTAGSGKWVYTSDHLPIIIDLSIGASDSRLVTLQKPLATDEGTDVSIYSGTPDTSWYTGDKSEYTLNTADALMGFHQLRQGQNSFEGVTIKLGTNMVINTGDASDYGESTSLYQWKRLNSEYYFKGTFDGQGHYISGVYMEMSNGAGGLLGGLGGNAVIKDFSLVNSYYKTPKADEAKNRLGTIAALVAADANVTIHNVYSDACVGENEMPFSKVGGILGYVNQNATVTLDHCIYNGTIDITGDYAGGMIGQVNHNGAKVYITECANSGSIKAANYGGGLIGSVSAAGLLHIQDSVMLGKLDALQYSGGIVGAIENCADFVINGCVVNGDIEFSRIANISADAAKRGCQVGGLVGRTYNVTGHVSNCALYGTMKATKNVVTAFPEATETNYYCSGGIYGFNSIFTDDIEQTDKKYSYIHTDYIAISMDMIDVDSYIGGSRNSPINTSDTNIFSKMSYGAVIYDADKRGSMALYGMRVDKNRRLDEEKFNQISGIKAFSSVDFITGSKALATQSHNYYDWYIAFTLWSEQAGSYLVPNHRVREVIDRVAAAQELNVVAYQTKANGDSTTDYRYVAVMRNCDHAGIGFRVKISYGSTVREETVYCKTVYSAIEGGGESYQASNYNGDYLAALVIKNVPDSVKNIRVEITPIGSDGTAVYDNYITNVFMLNMQ